MSARTRIAALAAMTMPLAMVGAAPAQAAVTTQLATADSMVRGDQTSATFGSNDTMRVDDGAPKISYVKFATAPAGTVTDAKLKVHGTGNEATAFKVYKVASTWAEGTLNYSNRPALGAQVGAGTFVTSGYTTVDVDAGVTGGQVTSLAIVRTSSGTDTVLSTRETANDPELVVTTGDVTPPPPAAACGDGVDNDGDGKIDYPADPGCTSATDTDETDTVTPPPGDNPPTVNAGADQTITLPDNNAALNGTVTDDGSFTVQWTGPTGVSFANAAAVDTTATFTAAGTYDLRLTANDGVNPAVSDVVRVVVNPEATPPPPTGAVDYKSLGMSRDYLMSLPTSGTQWSQVLSQANDSYSILIGDGNTDGSGNAVAGGLVYARTGDTAMRNKVNAALDTVQASNPADWWHAAANRKMIGWVQAAELVGRPVRTSGGALTAWGQFIQAQTTVTHGGPSRSGVMTRAAYGWDNNHGAAARQSLAAIQAVLGDTAGLAKSCRHMEAFLAGKSRDGSVTFVASTSPGSNQMGWSDEAASWYVSGNLAGIGPVGNGLRSGAVASDTWRDGGTYPTIGSAGRDHYIAGNLMREGAASGILNANGCQGIWQVGDSALLRGEEWIVANNITNASPHNGTLGLFNDAYGRNFGTATSRAESYAGQSHWLALGSGWAATS